MKELIGLVTGLAYLCLGFFYSFKLLEHIQATELLWFLYWFMIPLAIGTIIINALVKNV